MFDSMSLWIGGLGAGVVLGRGGGGGSQSEGGVDVIVSFFFCGCPRVNVEDGMEEDRVGGAGGREYDSSWQDVVSQGQCHCGCGVEVGGGGGGGGDGAGGGVCFPVPNSQHLLRQNRQGGGMVSGEDGWGGEGEGGGLEGEVDKWRPLLVRRVWTGGSTDSAEGVGGCVRERAGEGAGVGEEGKEGEGGRRGDLSVTAHGHRVRMVWGRRGPAGTHSEDSALQWFYLVHLPEH
jgi:hypothetical protein